MLSHRGDEGEREFLLVAGWHFDAALDAVGGSLDPGCGLKKRFSSFAIGTTLAILAGPMPCGCAALMLSTVNSKSSGRRAEGRISQGTCLKGGAGLTGMSFGDFRSIAAPSDLVEGNSALNELTTTVGVCAHCAGGDCSTVSGGGLSMRWSVASLGAVDSRFAGSRRRAGRVAV